MSGLPPQIFQDPLDFLEAICEALELTETQRLSAERSYAAVGEWFNRDDSSIAFLNPVIYPQGSIALGTTVKPLHRSDFDVDLICQLDVGWSISAQDLFLLVERELQAHGTYRKMLSRKNRCIRMNYEPDYHLDVTPAKPNWTMGGTHILVPDRELKVLKDSNPKGYVAFFKGIAQMPPKIRHLVMLANEARVSNKAVVEPLPQETTFEKKALQRIVQILKRHRDLYFADNPMLAVISVIITTLAAKSYQRVVSHEFDSLTDFVEAVVRDIPNGVEKRETASGIEWWIPNPSSPSENFAEKWNASPEKKQAFDAWHVAVLSALDEVMKPKTPGLHALAANNSVLLGERLVKRVLANHGKKVLSLQNTGQIAVGASSIGLSVTSPTKAVVGTTVRPNTYFGS